MDKEHSKAATQVALDSHLRPAGLPSVQTPVRPLIASWSNLPPRAREKLREGENEHPDAIVPGETRVMRLHHIRSGLDYNCEVSYIGGALVVKTVERAA